MNAPSRSTAEESPSAHGGGFKARLDSYFEVSARGSNFAREVRGGMATFFAMAYIVVLNPLIIGTAPDKNGDTLGIPQVAAVTALVAGVVCVLMGVVSRYPFAIAAGMGLNAIVAYVLAPVMTWADVMGLLIIEGVILLVLVLTGFRAAVFAMIPGDLKCAISVGVGLFLALIGFVNAGFVRPGEGTPLQLGVDGLDGWPVLVFVVGLLLTIGLIVRRVRGALLIGIAFATALGIALEVLRGIGPRVGPDGTVVDETGWSLTVPALPTSLGDLVSMPDLSLVGNFDLLGSWANAGVVTVVMLLFTLLLADFFDTMGTMVGVANQAGLTDEHGNMKRTREVLVVDAMGTILGGVGSASVNTVYAESAAGVGEGARTGIAPMVTGGLFFVAMFFTPLVGLVPFEAATPVLVVVGFMMMTQVTRIDFTDLGIGIPAFLAIVVMPYTYSIANGIGAAFIAFAFIRLVQGRWRELSPLLWIVVAIFVIHFAEAPFSALLGL
ncbi:AGZA family xanthine/uracil permease-like MFS transporter [Nocardiopsis mwathae]|uniref:AGZA family xanthine/uracil permease-like MFS transporter n=1 Tax=Nocardiopsis mwathae TaxID=1472723 RepID=A0A7W9YKD5_9ACTN|nr:AGZA family xanthine/uracil permease-like MFS transporter [Nocardiopsis mwathae]